VSVSASVRVSRCMCVCPRARCRYSKMRATCVWAMADYLHTLGNNGLVMSWEARQRAHVSGQRFLMRYQWLAATCFDQRKCLYKLRPKHHYYAHVCDRHLHSAVNPRFYHNFQDEDFMGKIARLCGKVNSASVMLRAMQRYLLFLALRMEAQRRAEAPQAC